MTIQLSTECITGPKKADFSKESPRSLISSSVQTMIRMINSQGHSKLGGQCALPRTEFQITNTRDKKQWGSRLIDGLSRYFSVVHGENVREISIVMQMDCTNWQCDFGKHF